MGRMCEDVVKPFKYQHGQEKREKICFGMVEIGDNAVFN